jgi:vacuolar-type H+-ATPase subunit H
MWYKGRGGTEKPMQEIVTKVLEAEKAAEQGIQEARSKAGEIRARADREVQDTMQQAREQAGRPGTRIRRFSKITKRKYPGPWRP